MSNPERPDASAYIFFVLRGRSLESDIQLWDSIRAALSSRPVMFEAYCDTEECASMCRALRASPPFDVYGFGQVGLLKLMSRADRSGSALVFDRRRMVVGSFQWRGEPAARAEAELRSLLP